MVYMDIDRIANVKLDTIITKDTRMVPKGPLYNGVLNMKIQAEVTAEAEAMDAPTAATSGYNQKT